MARGDFSYKRGGGTVVLALENTKILILTQRNHFDLHQPDTSSLQPELKKHCKAWRRWVSRCCKHFTYYYVCGISMGFIHECCWMSLILQMDWCPLWGLNWKRPVSVLIVQLSLPYTVYKTFMLSVCTFAVILLCSSVNWYCTNNQSFILKFPLSWWWRQCYTHSIISMLLYLAYLSLLITRHKFPTRRNEKKNNNTDL